MALIKAIIIFIIQCRNLLIYINNCCKNIAGGYAVKMSSIKYLLSHFGLFILISLISLSLFGCKNIKYFYFTSETYEMSVGESIDVLKLKNHTNITDFSNIKISLMNEDVASLRDSEIFAKSTGECRIILTIITEGQEINAGITLKIYEKINDDYENGEIQSPSEDVNSKFYYWLSYVYESDSMTNYIFQIYKMGDNYSNFIFETTFIEGSKSQVNRIGTSIQVLYFHGEEFEVNITDIENNNIISITFPYEKELN